MSDVDERVRAALDAQTVPEGLAERTLAAIEAARPRAEGGACPGAGPVMSRGPRRRWWPAALAAAACLALVLVGVGVTTALRQPAAYVGIDVNPSLELAVNRLGTVVGAEALNDDGARVLDAVALDGRPYEEALADLAASPALAPYVGEGSLLEVSIASDDASLADLLDAQTAAALASLPCEHASARVGAEVHEHAASAGMGMARYQAAQELLALDDTLTLEDCASLSMRELRDRIDACAGHGADGTDDGHGDGTAQGHGGGHAGAGAQSPGAGHRRGAHHPEGA